LQNLVLSEAKRRRRTVRANHLRFVFAPLRQAQGRARIEGWAVLALVFVGAGVFAQQADTTGNPLGNSPASIAAGRLLYDQTCQSCHGPAGQGDRGPALNAAVFARGGEDRDLFRTIREGVKLGRDIASRKGIDPFRGRETAPGPDCRTDAEIDAFVRRTAITAHHPCATCAMGIGEDAVLDPALRVRGVEGLRVADASAMPDLVSGNINACVLMIAEKAADLVLGKPPLPAVATAHSDSTRITERG